ncbi:MAG: pyridoxal phosphate-dependent aminotransferase [Dehalococcoidia bacterium]|nr:pyridoxal phosphate-dependent aminotransferase [Dehalococcoidia bacterium]
MSMSHSVSQQMVEGSWIRRMFEEGSALKALHGADKVFDLSLGNPIVEPPTEFKNELRRVVEASAPGMHRYMANAGYEETRAAVARQIALETGVKLGVRDVVMTCGASGAMNVILKTVLDPGEEVIIFAPYFVEFVSYIGNHGGKPRVVGTDDGFMPDLDQFEAAINANTKAVIVNSPNNPSGVVYPESLVHRMGEILSSKQRELGKQIYLISDEPYRTVLYDGLEPVSVFRHYDNCVVVSSHSKDLALPGERIGYAVLNPSCEEHDALMAGFIHCNRVLGFVNAPALMQHVVAGLQGVTVSISEYERKRDLLYAELSGMGYQLVKPEGAFYMFPRSPVDDDVEFVRELLSLLVLVVPGRGFGTPGYFRISYCLDDRTLEGSLEGFLKASRLYGLK